MTPLRTLRDLGRNLGLGLGLSLGLGLPAAAIELPRQLAWTAYDTGSTGFNQAVAIGAALQNAVGTQLRVLPGGNDVARMEPLRQGRVAFSATGIGGGYMASEGVFEFGAPEWGPQPVRVLLANNSGEFGLAVGVAADLGIETYADLRGKRIAWVLGSPALNVAMGAFLAYGGLSWDDVERVDFGGYGASLTGLISGDVDAVFASTNSGRAYEAEASPRGIFWPPMDPDDAEALARMQAIAPYFTVVNATVGAAIPETGWPTAGYAYPILTAMADQDEALVYNMTKAMVELFDQYDGDVPGIGGWHLSFQNFEWVTPYHDGAIRYFREVDAWTDDHQAHNDMLVARQNALIAAWDELKAEAPADWAEAWAAKRREALAAGGFAVVF